MTVGLPLFFCVFYFSLQRLHLTEPRRFELTWLDRWIGFDPTWIWAYQSAYILMPIPPWLTASRKHLTCYIQGMALLSLVGFTFFAFYPVECPRPDVVPDSGMYALLVAYDATSNAFPSLHCALATYTVLYGHRTLGEGLSRSERGALSLVLALWTAAIFYSTLATKQHYFLDLPAGFSLAWLSHRLTWKGS